MSSNSSDFIKWPERGRYEEESTVFHKTSKISGIIGAIAVSHVKILRPKDDAEKYNNKKNYYSIAVQGNTFFSIYV